MILHSNQESLFKYENFSRWFSKTSKKSVYIKSKMINTNTKYYWTCVRHQELDNPLKNYSGAKEILKTWNFRPRFLYKNHSDLHLGRKNTKNFIFLGWGIKSTFCRYLRVAGVRINHWHTKNIFHVQ